MELPVNYNNCNSNRRRAVREEYVRIQDGKCHHCGMPLNEQPSNEVVAAYIDLSLFPPKFLEWPVHLHHDHDTGMTIGAVHARCNAYLWQYHGE